MSLCFFSDIQQIVSDPVQAVNDAVDEVSSLLNKFQGTYLHTHGINIALTFSMLSQSVHNCMFLLECAPDLSDPMSAATYAAEEIAQAKDGFVQYFSDEEGV